MHRPERYAWPPKQWAAGDWRKNITDQIQVPGSTEPPPSAIATGPRPDLTGLPAPHGAVTRRLYAADWQDFAAWCRQRRHAALPATPATLAAYLAALAPTLKPGTLTRRAAAIADQHRRANLVPPGADDAVRAILRDARVAVRAFGRATAGDTGLSLPSRPARPRSSPAPAQLRRMAARCPGDLAGLRDRALLLLTASGLGGERLLALDREHVRFTQLAAELAPPVIAEAGTEGGAGEVAVVTRATVWGVCPVRALDDWLRSSDTRFGPVFRKVDRWGNVEHRRLRPDGLRRILARRATALRPGRRAPEHDAA